MCMQVMHTCTLARVVCGYHEYQHIWNAPVDGREIQYAREPSNPMDTYVVAILGQSTGGYVGDGP